MKRVLVVCNHFPVDLGRYMRDAFHRVGADVRSVGPDLGSVIWGLKLDASRAWKPDGPIDAFWPDWTPDLVVHSMQPPVRFHPHYRDVPHVVYTVDNHHMDFRGEGIAHYFLGHLHSRVMPVSGPTDTWLPCAYDPAAFTPGPVPFSQREFDLAMVGELYPHRVEILKAMKAAGFKVMAGMGAVYDQYRNIYHQARISLCPSACGDVGQRIFETAAMNCLILADSCEDFSSLRADGIVIYENIADAVEKARRYLADPQGAQQMIARSSAWAKPHTWDARANVILKWIEQRQSAG
ncbi:MAG: glycosyltransferase [Tepidisphaeraceae bacterium]